MAERGAHGILAELAPPGVVALGIVAAGVVITRGAATSAWWTLHAGAVVVGASLLAGAGLLMHRSAYPPLASLAAAFVVALALLASATLLGDPARGTLLIPIWGVGGGFLLILLPPPGPAPRASSWALLSGAALLATGVLVATMIIRA